MNSKKWIKKYYINNNCICDGMTDSANLFDNLFTILLSSGIMGFGYIVMKIFIYKKENDQKKNRLL